MFVDGWKQFRPRGLHACSDLAIGRFVVGRHFERVLLFATRLSEGEHNFTYVARATTSGTFRTAPTHAEEMYEPEVFGRTGSAVVTVQP